MTDNVGPVLAIVGPTASGKTALALKAAKHLSGEVINCDAVQVYRGLDIGSAKPSEEERSLCPHHLFDYVDIDENYNAGRYSEECRRVVQQVHANHRLPIIVGGTGLYLRSAMGYAFDDFPTNPVLREELLEKSAEELLKELLVKDPVRAAEVHPNDKVRLVRAVEIIRLTGKAVSEIRGLESQNPIWPNLKVIFLEPSRALLHERVRQRTSKMLENGLISEVQKLLASGCDPEAKALKSIGYREVVEWLQGGQCSATRKLLEEKITISTRKYVKRQCTWFRKAQVDLRLELCGEDPLAWAKLQDAVAEWIPN